MASKTITRNDLTNILNEVLPPTPSEYRKLLWSNPNPTSQFAAQTVSLDLSDYDEVEVVSKPYSSDTSYFASRVKVGNKGMIYSQTGYGSPVRIYGTQRNFTPTSTGVAFGDGLDFSASTNNAYCVPYQIYGISYDRVAPPQIEIEETFNNVEAVASLPYTPSHSGILTLYMLQNGTSAVWRSVRITDQTTNTHTDFGTYFADTTYGGVSFHLPVIKGHTYIVASGGSDLYFEASRSYLTY